MQSTDVLTISMADFIAREGLTMMARKVDSRPDGLMGNSATHWHCVLNAGRKIACFAGESLNMHSAGHKPVKMVVYFSQGIAHTSPPTLPEVLDCLASDSTYGNDFEEFCDELGYDSDSRQAERIFKAIQRQTNKLLELFCETANRCPVLDDLRYNVERL